MKKHLKIANAQAFWGDRTEAAAELLRQQSDLDFITLDYLSEVSMSIMAVQRAKDPLMGYAGDFIEVIKTLAPFWRQGSKVKVVTNAGGLDPRKCAQACAEILKKECCPPMRIGVISGDDVLENIRKNPKNSLYCDLESGRSIQEILDNLVTANAYLGAKPIVEALLNDADIVITGRVADPSLTVGPCVARYGWNWNDYERLSQATVAGHLIECGTQVTGGISNGWMDMEEVVDIGFPYVEMDESGTFVVTKPRGTGGSVSQQTVKEQLIYEIGDPNAYLSPDVTVSFLSLFLENDGENRVVVRGAKGKAPPPNYKVSATYRDGFRAEGTLAIFGRGAKEKAKRCGKVILERVKRLGYELERTCVECLGSGDVVPSITNHNETLECVLRVAAADHRREALECFARQIAPMVTSGPAGTTGYTSGRPHIRPVFGYWPCLIPVDEVQPCIEYIEVRG